MRAGKAVMPAAANDARPQREADPAGTGGATALEPRAAILVTKYPQPSQTFVERHIRHLFGGNTVVVCTEMRGPGPAGTPTFARRTARRNPLDRGIGPAVRTWNRITTGSSRPVYGRHRRELAAFLRDQGVDVIVGEFGTETLAVHDLAGEMGLPCVSYFRGIDASAALRDPGIRRAYGTMFRDLEAIVCVSHALLDNLAAHGLTHPNAHVIPSGVDVRAFRPAPKRPRSFLACGRLVPKKAPLVTIEAFAHATRKAPEATLQVIGDGPLLGDAQALAQRLGVGHRVSFDGEQPHDAVRAALANTEILLQHSVTDAKGDTEGLPTIIQEALASGCAVIATRHAGIPEAVTHGVTGWLSEEYDLTTFARHIRESLNADKVIMGAAARADAVNRFDNRELLSRFEGVLLSAIATKKSIGVTEI